MINNVVLIGRLTRDVELRYTPSNVAKVQRPTDYQTCLATIYST